MGDRKRIYLDNCCFNRPYDDQTQLSISLETQAKLKIQTDIKAGKIELVDSFILRYEISQNPYFIRRAAANEFLDKNGSLYISADLENIISNKAATIMRSGIRFKDACHIACAMYAGCDYLVTTDKRMRKYASDEIKIVDPIQMIEILEDEDNE